MDTAGHEVRGSDVRVRVERFTACNDAEDRIADFALARNHCFSLVTTPWAVWLDSDDVVEPSSAEPSANPWSWSGHRTEPRRRPWPVCARKAMRVR